MKLTLTVAVAIIDASLAKAREMNLAPMCIAVVDAGGNLMALKREDECTIVRSDLAIAKAWGSVAFGISGSELEERAQRRPWFLGSVSTLMQGKIVPVAGSLPIRRDGALIGAVGATGAIGTDDEICLHAALASTGFEVA